MKTIKITSESKGFAEDKDEARRLREEHLLPALEKGQSVAIDFSNVTSATQSFIHALIGQALQRFGEDVLDKIEFKNCSITIKSVIELVIDYSLAGFEDIPE